MKTKLLIIVLIASIAITACVDQHAEVSTPKITTAPIIQTVIPSPKPTGTAIQSTRSAPKNILEEKQNNLPTITNTPTRTSTNTPSLTPFATSVSTLEAHAWLAENPLASYINWGGDGCCQYPRPPRLTLYSGGQLFIYYPEAEPYPQLLTKKLTRQEICAFLNTIDQLGFFDYDSSTYQIDRYDRQIEYFPIDGSSSLSEN